MVGMRSGTNGCVTKTIRPQRFLNALRRESVDCTPVWLMRQAGRYLPEYRETRKEAGDFLTLCKTPELACQVTLQPLRRFDLDAAIVFSDILTIPDAMGLGLVMHEKKGPRFQRPIRSEMVIKNLRIPDPTSDLDYVMETLRLTRRELQDRIPLIGFSGSPWTLATYMIERTSNDDFRPIKELLYELTSVLQKLLDILTESVTVYLMAQIKAGAQSLMIFDTWGGILAHAEFLRFSLLPISKVIAQLRNDSTTNEIPIILFVKGGNPWITEIAATGCTAVSCDWTMSLGAARTLIGDRVALQGNLDPSVLFAPITKIREQISLVLDDFGKGTGHIFNLGHGIPPGVDPDHVAALVDGVHQLSKNR